MLILDHGTTDNNIRKLQHMQNTLARVVVGRPYAASSAELLYKLDWLHVYHRISFNIALLTVKIITLNLVNQPSYLFYVVMFRVVSHCLRVSSQNLIHQSTSRTVAGSHAFNSPAPTLEVFTHCYSLLFLNISI
jgi:hypothetical protein